MSTIPNSTTTEYAKRLKVVHHNDKAPEIKYVVPEDHDCEHPPLGMCSPTDEYSVVYRDKKRRLADEMVRRWNAHDELVAALERIELGEGRFSRDPLTHASNTIEDMVSIARAALAKARGES